jgi:ribosomal protein S18 acetylase RimI-like enzyme
VCVADPWLTTTGGLPSYRLRTDADVLEALSDLRSPASAEVHCLLEGEAFIYAKLPVSPTNPVGTLEELGFRVIDTGLGFAKQLDGGPAPTRASVRPATPEDEESVTRVAARAFTMSRFHLDPLFGSERANRVKEAWARAYFAGERGEEMVVAERDGDLVGFLLLLRPDAATAVIDLIGMVEDAHGAGLGEAMIALGTTLLPGVSTMTMHTQAANVGAVRFYERLGFTFTGATYCLHAHGTGAAS